MTREMPAHVPPGPAHTSEAGADAVDLLAELVSIDSVNPGLVAGAAGEQRIVDRLSSRLAQSGFTVTVVPASGREGRLSLVAVPTTTADVPTVVLNGHLDTVGVAGMTDPFTPRVEGARLYGRGAADMKGGVAALVVAAERLVAAGAPVRPVLALVADEEDANVGSEAVIEALQGLGVRPHVCLIAEPTDLVLARSLRGFAVVRVSFPGWAAHSSQADLDVNAERGRPGVLASIAAVRLQGMVEALSRPVTMISTRPRPVPGHRSSHRLDAVRVHHAAAHRPVRPRSSYSPRTTPHASLQRRQHHQLGGRTGRIRQLR